MMTLQKYKNSSTSPPLLENLCTPQILRVALGREPLVTIWRLLQKSIVSQSCMQDCPDFAERMKRKALRVRSEGSIHPYVTEAEFRKQHSDSPLCNRLI